uniref:Carboxylesterase type B domain-containing protein n=1 Tax=Timema cristinae TaxID=61476 RepID=A0A7R9DJ28_TIMCR|nr:unnamed protein product [Timema cristinae]
MVCLFQGFLSTGDSHAPGNYGLKDQVAALRWVQRNIVYFGGDPDSVTILGAQAGAVSAHYHILSPQSTGLFRNAISQSGTALTPWGLLDGQEARTRAFKLGKLLGCRKNELKDSQALVRCLRMKEAGDISRQAVDTVDRVSEISYPFVPVVEPEGVLSPFLPDHPLRLMAENDAGVPWLAGVVRHEGLPQALQAMVFPALMDGLNDETDKFLLQYIGLSVQPKERARSIARKIWNYYFHNDTLEYANLARLADVTTDYHYFYGLAKTVELQGAVSRAPIFVYEFSYSNRESSMVLGELEVVMSVTRGELVTCYLSDGEEGGS